MSDKIFSMLLSLRAKKNVPYTVSVEMVKFLQDFTVTLFDEIATALTSTVASIVKPELIPSAVAVIVEKLEKAKNIFEDYKTEHNIQKLYGKHPMFVEPKTVIIGQRVKNAVGLDGVVRSKIKYIEAQHVSVQSTVAMKFQNQRFCDAIFGNRSQQHRRREDGALVWYQDGDKFKQQPIVDKYNTPDAIVIDIQLYTDGLQLTNQISEAAVRHGSTMFYFLILNLLPKYYASLSNIDLLACCKSKDIKEKSGQDAMLQVIVDELSVLETDGFELKILNLGIFRVYVRMFQFTADNLAVHETFGLIESFSHDFSCALCYCTREEMQLGTRECFFNLRTRESHALDLAGLLNVELGCHIAFR